MSVTYPIPEDEGLRISTLAEYGLLDTAEEEGFDRLARLAASLFDVPVVLISLLGESHQHFKSHVGIDMCETGRDVSFCAHAIMQDDIFLVPDALEDPRFVDNALVTGDPYIRFYAGKPLVAANGMKIGTVCLIDREPRYTFSDKDRAHLEDIAALVLERMELHRRDQIKDVSRARFESIAETSPDAIVCTDESGAVTFWNQSAERLFGYTAEEIKKYRVDVLVPEDIRPLYELELGRLLAGEEVAAAEQTVELIGRHRSGRQFPAEYSLSMWQDGDRASVGAIIRDISERKSNERKLFRLASLDPLTGLPNRAAWREELTHVIEQQQPATVAIVDLDGFKDVNDSLGHSAGDHVLKEVAARLQDACEEATMVARLGGDEFVVLLEGNDERKARRLGHALIESVSGLYEFAGHHVELGTSAGISLYPQHGDEPEQVLGAADLALYRAKDAGRERYELFDPSLRRRAVERRAFQRELRTAFNNREFELFYQPQFSTDGHTLVGAEALIRWNHPVRGLLGPDSFIEVLSEKPSAPAIGEWIIRTACEQAVHWREQVPDFRVAVNLFGSQLRSKKLTHAVDRTLKDTGLPADALELEIVETILTSDDDATKDLLQELRDLGVRLAFDDYGTGYASLSLLKRYPVSRLKIDRTFVHNVAQDPENAAVVNAILYLARTFDLEVCAEGVETQEELAFLRQGGCETFQGYLVSRPVPADEFTRHLVKH